MDKNMNYNVHYTTALFVRAKCYKHPQSLSIGDFVGKSWYIHTIKYNRVLIKKGEVLCILIWEDLKIYY